VDLDKAINDLKKPLEILKSEIDVIKNNFIILKILVYNRILNTKRVLKAP
jgi:hypothetical protein